jgi:hypothetical protein
MALMGEPVGMRIFLEFYVDTPYLVCNIRARPNIWDYRKLNGAMRISIANY